MSKTSYLLIVVMAGALLYMGALRGYQAYARKAAEKAAAAEANGSAFTFQNVPVSLAAPMPEPVSRPVEFQAVQQPVYLENQPLSPEKQTQQAQETIASILADYQEDPTLQQFNKDLAAATQGRVNDLGALGGKELGRILQENPQVAEIVQKNMQNPEFAKTVQQIFSNPQFIQSVQQLQGAGAVPPKKAE